jgi:hypothetical protein
MRCALRFVGMVAVLLVPHVSAAQIFEQGPVGVRPLRNPAMEAGQAHDVNSENLFGFTLGSDIDEPGSSGLALETVGAFGRRDGRYAAGNAKLELSHAPLPNFAVSLSLLGGAWNIKGNATLPDTYAWRFRGIGGELRWRLLERGPERFGMTLHLEPSATMADEEAGQAGTGFASENRLIVDTALVHDQLWAAVNLLYDLETFRPWTGGPTEEASVAGIAGAVTGRVSRSVLLGAELRYLYAFDGLTLGRQVGRALYIGPTGYWRISETAWLSAACNMQIAGHANHDPNRLDLVNFSRHLVRLKLGIEF